MVGGGEAIGIVVDEGGVEEGAFEGVVEAGGVEFGDVEETSVVEVEGGVGVEMGQQIDKVELPVSLTE